MPEIGVIAIGRNEGERLRRCLASLVGQGWPVVYVDSASTDDSPAMAREMGAEVVNLDMSIPFSAARARNEGMTRLLAIAPDVKYVQMVDGDCEVVAGWVDRAKAELDARPEAAVVCGRRRERFPHASVYNQVADVEWSTPVGEAKSCGGDAMVRVAAFKEAGGYDNSVVAGEEPELCQRLREKGWKIFRIDGEMTVHDSAMTRFAQWWKRTVRSGYGAMDVATRFRRGEEGLFMRQVKAARTWALKLPLALLLLTEVVAAAVSIYCALNERLLLGVLLAVGMHLLAVVVYFALMLIQSLRFAKRARSRDPSFKAVLLYAIFTHIGTWGHFAGQQQYKRDRKAGKIARMIDYKTAGQEAVLAS